MELVTGRGWCIILLLLLQYGLVWMLHSRRETIGSACASVWQGCNKRTVKRYHLIDKLSLQGSGRERSVNRARGGLSRDE